jgi:hypothetical protein
MHQHHLLLIYTQNEPNSAIREHLGLVSARSGRDRVLWVSAAPPGHVSAALARYLASGEVLSAALVPADIPDDRLWVASEWRGAFFIDRGLAPLLGDALGGWVEDPDYAEHSEFRILRPRRPAGPEGSGSGSAVQVETAREYVSAIADDRAVLVRTRLAAVRESMGEWFGELADPRVGGGLALLALSGATSQSAMVALRSPAALRLTVTASDVSLANHVREGRLAVRGYGHTWTQVHAAAEFRSDRSTGAVEPRLAENPALHASYGVLLQLEALVDPEVEIEAGAIFEQVSMNDVQTLSAAANRRLTVQPGTFAPVPVPAWCLNSSLAAPAGEPVRPTPLVLATPGRSQDEVWAERRSVLTGGTR